MMAKKRRTLQDLYDEKVKEIYVVVMNIGGLLHDKVYTCKRSEDAFFCGYWEENGDTGWPARQFAEITLGKNTSDSGWYWTFVFLDKNEAEQFLNGAREVLCFIQNTWFKNYSNLQSYIK